MGGQGDAPQPYGAFLSCFRRMFRMVLLLILGAHGCLRRHGSSREAGGSGREDGGSQPSGAPSSAPSGAAPNSLPPARVAEPAGLGEVAVAGAEEDEMMADVAALAGGGAGGDALATLEGALRPIERYAVRLVEEARPHMWLPSWSLVCKGQAKNRAWIQLCLTCSDNCTGAACSGGFCLDFMPIAVRLFRSALEVDASGSA